MKVSIVVPVYKGKDLVKKNIPSLIQAKSLKKNNIIEIIAVDDFSQDGSADLIKKEFTQVKLIRHKANKGFAASVNQGVRSASGELVCILNQDVKVEKDFLSKVFKHFRDDRVFGVSLHEEEFGWTNGEFSNGFIVHESGRDLEKPHSTFWISGGSGVFRKKYWKKLKGFDSELYKPFYWEDVDLSYRALKRGYKLVWEPEAKVTHSHESTINEDNFNKNKLSLIKERNYLLFNWKNITSPNLGRKHLSGLIKRIARHPGYLRIVLMSLPKLRIIFSRRKTEKKKTKVSDEAVLAKY